MGFRGYAGGHGYHRAYAIRDIVFEVDNKSLTNRPDLWGHYGIAREFFRPYRPRLKPLETVELSRFDSLPPLIFRFSTRSCATVTLA